MRGIVTTILIPVFLRKYYAECLFIFKKKIQQCFILCLKRFTSNFSIDFYPFNYSWTVIDIHMSQSISNNNYIWPHASCRWRKYLERWLIPPTYTTINHAECLHLFPSLLKNLLLSKDYIWITFDSIIFSFYCMHKVTQIPLPTSTTFHWICWNILWHLLVHKTHNVIELIVSQTTPFWTKLLGIHGDTSSTYRPLVYNAIV